MDDYEEDYDMSCPECGHSPLRHRDCTNFCEDGFFDESYDDPINFMEGEAYYECPECKGLGHIWWCPKCGADLTGKLTFKVEEYE